MSCTHIMADLVFGGKGKMFDIWIRIPHIKDCTSQKSLKLYIFAELHEENLLITVAAQTKA
jgi:hypothetical protein